MTTQPEVSLTGRAPTSPGDFYTVAPATGTIPALYVRSINTVARTTGYIEGASISVAPAAGLDAWQARALLVEVNASATATCSVQAIGAQINISGFTSISDVYGLKMYVAMSCAPAGGSACIRMDDDSADGKELDAFLMMSNKFRYGPLYIMQFQTLLGHAFSGLDDKSGGANSGWLKVYFTGGGGGSGARYIQLYKEA